MKNLCFYLGLFLTLCQIHLLQATKNKSCTVMVKELGDAQSKFIYCATVKSVPVNLCVGCKDLYHNLQEEYGALTADANCSQLYLNSDRIKIVATTQGILTGLWDKANCDDCFIRNNSVTYDMLSTTLRDCVHSNKQNVCIACKVAYLDLNNFYMDMEKGSKGKVCFDLQDNMNRTRLNWSKDLKCCQREVKLINFLIAVGVVVLFPIVTFYVTAIVVTKRREANHELLNELEPELDAPSTSALITAAVLSTRTEPSYEISARNEKIADVLERTVGGNPLDDSDSDNALVKRKVARRSHPDSETDTSSDDEPHLSAENQKAQRSDYSSDDEPIVKSRRS
ncbi:hypothetical protein KR067_008483 [Drosophila pandora]|nr:hypothetical protein KR067_001841 [Drosophila pandora]KAH8319420.1 hypothetical protein KR067_008483 [Drosophila pandora]